MIYLREQYFDFLERELKAQSEDFLAKVQSPAIHLLEVNGEIFLGKFLGIKNGQAILKMNNERGLPRKGSHLNALVLPANLRNYHNWEKLTYGDLTKRQDCNCELSCVWHGKINDDNRFSLVGFSGITADFAARIDGTKGIILVLGPQIPPTEFLFNLQKIVHDNNCIEANSILDADFVEKTWKPISLDDCDIPAFLNRQLEGCNTAILQGPPGTGKTTTIASLCSALMQQGKSILVTAMTNRALVEIASKKELSEALNRGLIRKTNLTLDEAAEVNGLAIARDFFPMQGRLLLSTNFITSGAAINSFPECGFDYVIMDEASQVILPMFAAAARLGKKQLWVGDLKQLAPASLVHEKNIQKYNFYDILDGFKTLSVKSSIPNYMLSVSYRLTVRAAKYTNNFYNNSLKSSKTPKLSLSLPPFCHKDGGPTLITIDMPQSFVCNEIMAITVMSVNAIYESLPDAHVAVLSCFKETSKHLHRALLQYGLLNKNLLVETVARVQGLTTDFTIFVIPNTSLVRSLEPRLFNVATSRALRNTIIVADTNILENCRNEDVRNFMYILYNDISAHFQLDASQNLFLDNKKKLF